MQGYNPIRNIYFFPPPNSVLTLHYYHSTMDRGLTPIKVPGKRKYAPKGSALQSSKKLVLPPRPQVLYRVTSSHHHTKLSLQTLILLSLFSESSAKMARPAIQSQDLIMPVIDELITLLDALESSQGAPSQHEAAQVEASNVRAGATANRDLRASILICDEF